MDDVKSVLVRVARAIRRRPVRVAQALVAVAGAAGVALEPQAAEGILTVAGLLLTGMVGGEAAQRKRERKRRSPEVEGESDGDGDMPDLPELPDEPGL